MVDTGAVRTPHFWLRLVELVFAIIAFAPIAEWAGYSRVDYAIFCGVTTMVFSLVFMAGYLLGIRQAKGLFALIIDIIWCIFWLACAAALSDMIGWWYGFYYSSSKSRLQAATAFAWLTWFLFIGQVVLDVMDLRSGGGKAVTMPAEPSTGAPPAGAAVVTTV